MKLQQLALSSVPTILPMYCYRLREFLGVPAESFSSPNSFTQEQIIRLTNKVILHLKNNPLTEQEVESGIWHDEVFESISDVPKLIAMRIKKLESQNKEFDVVKHADDLIRNWSQQEAHKRILKTLANFKVEYKASDNLTLAPPTLKLLTLFLDAFSVEANKMFELAEMLEEDQESYRVNATLSNERLSEELEIAKSALAEEKHTLHRNLKSFIAMVNNNQTTTDALSNALDIAFEVLSPAMKEAMNKTMTMITNCNNSHARFENLLRNELQSM